MSKMRMSNLVTSKTLGCMNSCFAGLMHGRFVYVFLAVAVGNQSYTLIEEEDVPKGIKLRLTSFKDEAGIFKMFIAQCERLKR
jgi:hypothetical protein